MGSTVAETGPAVAVAKAVPEMEVEVLPNVHVSHDDIDYYGAGYPIEHGESAGDTLTLDGPTAMALVMQGQVKIVRSL